ncbi:MAG: aminoacyl-tRNA hydrolase [Candidatus Moranbacteria bacterium]|jgi:PTH1 family peptidyl-tRNA hydrolase|nr:aminoacyl-tRNA hydrolase [Candidatus Moranbacteria bacterium]MBP9801122.1 aminoacyl-tRNA hydrolase [Candidatus Moranbacteria bacterium]
MKLIIGLGNPGKQYLQTRHNAGFRALDFLCEHFKFENFHQESRFHAEMSIGTVHGEKYLLIKPNTFMNQSGKTVHLLMQYYKLTPNDIIVLHDDLDIAPGLTKTTASSRAAGHNGVQNIIDQLGTQDFFRIRLGIGRPLTSSQSPNIAPSTCQSTHDYVLEKFPAAERILLESLFSSLPGLIAKISSGQLGTSQRIS